jgi:hypothetical protein
MNIVTNTPTAQEQVSTQTDTHSHKDEKRKIIIKITEGKQFSCKNRIFYTLDDGRLEINMS